MTMYLEHFGLTEAPFKITPHTEFFFSGANRGETLDALLYAITSGEGIVKVTGEVGAGKTMLCRVLMERLPETVETIYLAVPSLSRDEMLATIAGDLDIETQGVSTTKLIRALQERLIDVHAEGRQVVALIDEAHAMPLDTLEEIRLLSNLETSHSKLMQIVLFGQPELDAHLSLQNMRQLRERITHSFNLLPLPARDIKDYVDFRLRAAGYKGPELFPGEALKLIGEASEGLTRRINIYCDKTLLAAFAAGTHTITPDLVRAAITDTQIVMPQQKSEGKSWLAATAGVIAGGIVGFMAGRATAPTSAPPSAPTPSLAPAPTIAPVIAPTSIQSAPPAPPAAGTAPTKSTAESLIPPDPIAAASADWLLKRAQADMARLQNLPASRHAIQLMTADERERSAIENYLRSASRELNADRIMLYLSGTAENPRVSVLYGNYGDRSEAAAELAGLPSKITQFRPYVRSFQAIRDDIRPASKAAR
jgi:MSHA biogenesis protein MshM